MKFLLVCNAGLSTSLVAQDISKEMAKRGIECTVDATGIDAMDTPLNSGTVDAILLAPQVKFLRSDVDKTLKRLKKEDIPVVDIERTDYGRRNAKNIVNCVFTNLGIS